MQIAKKRLGAVLLAVCLLAALAFGGIAAYAASAGTGNNTLTVNATTNPEDDIASAGVTVDVYKIASATASGSTYEYTFDVAPFTELGKSYAPASMTGAKWQDLADQAAEMLGDAKPMASAVPAGEAITGLEDGLYLVVAGKAHTALYEYTFNPTIVTLPTKEPLKDDAGNPILDEDGFPIIATSQEYGDWITTASITLKSSRDSLTGSLRIAKTVENADGKAATCTFDIKSTDDSPVAYENVASITFSQSGDYETLVTGIPVGAIVSVTETFAGTGYKNVSGDTSAKTIVADVLVEEGTASIPSAAFVNDSDGNPHDGWGIENKFELSKTGEGDTDWDWVWTQVPAATPVE